MKNPLSKIFTSSSKGLSSPASLHKLIGINENIDYLEESPRFFRVNKAGTATLTDQASEAVTWILPTVGELIRMSDVKKVITDGTCELIASW